VSEGTNVEDAALLEYRLRHLNDGCIPSAVERSLGGGDLLLQRNRRHDRLRRDPDFGRGLLSATLGRVRVCSANVDHQSFGGTVGQYRILPLRASVPPPTQSADPGLGGVHGPSLRLCPNAAPAG